MKWKFAGPRCVSQAELISTLLKNGGEVVSKAFPAKASIRLRLRRRSNALRRQCGLSIHRSCVLVLDLLSPQFSLLFFSFSFPPAGAFFCSSSQCRRLLAQSVLGPLRSPALALPRELAGSSHSDLHNEEADERFECRRPTN